MVDLSEVNWVLVKVNGCLVLDQDAQERKQRYVLQSKLLDQD